MASETIVAVYDTPAHAELAIADLQAAGIPATSIQHYTRDQYSSGTYDPAQAGTGATTMTGEKKEGFWGWLFGEDEAGDHRGVYDRSMQSGSTVVTVVVGQEHASKIVSILEDHAPVDLEERGAQYAASSATTSASTVGAPIGESQPGYTATQATGSTATGLGAKVAAGAEEVLSLSEEALQIGKRAVERGTTRVRRYVVERPVEEQVRLRDERVSVFRRPATTSTVGAGAFTEKTIEMTETGEEAVVGKTARVVEEVVLQKGVEERSETVRDTVRKEEVEITGAHGDTPVRNTI